MAPNKLPSLRSINSLQMVGVSHRTADLAVRSALSLNHEDARLVLDRLRSEGASEVFALSTCNRTEVYFVGSAPEKVIGLLSDHSGIPLDTLTSACYEEFGWGVVHHLFSVSAGLKSAAIGESEILGQLKSAFQLARQSGAVGKTLDPLIQRTLRASKRIRSESELGRRGLSLASVTVRRALASSSPSKPHSILIVGSGQIAESIAKNLKHQNARDVTICSRTFEKAITLADMNGFKAAPLSNLKEAISQANIIISAVSVDQPIIPDRFLAEAVAPGTVLVDLGVPRNISLSARSRHDLKLIELDDLLSDVSLNAAQIAEVTPRALEIAEEEVELYARECSEREAAPCIEALVQQSEKVRKQNLDWALAQIPEENARERKLLEDLSIRITRGMISEPIRSLKTDFQEPAERAVLARFFQAEV